MSIETGADLAVARVGRTIYEPASAPDYFNRGQRDVLTDGLVIAIEPIICAGARMSWNSAA